jgi:hypothetical protein
LLNLNKGNESEQSKKFPQLYKENKMTRPNESTFADEMAEKGLYAILGLVQVLINNAIWQTNLCWQVNELLENDGYFFRIIFAEKRLRYQAWSKMLR